MQFGNYTQKSLEAVQLAQQIVISNQNQQMEQIHLLAALLRQDGGLAPQLLKKRGITVESLTAAVNAQLDKLPPGHRKPGGGQVLHHPGYRPGAAGSREAGSADEGQLRVCGAFASEPD